MSTVDEQRKRMLTPIVSNSNNYYDIVLVTAIVVIGVIKNNYRMSL